MYNHLIGNSNLVTFSIVLVFQYFNQNDRTNHGALLVQKEFLFLLNYIHSRRFESCTIPKNTAFSDFFLRFGHDLGPFLCVKKRIQVRISGDFTIPYRIHTQKDLAKLEARMLGTRDTTRFRGRSLAFVSTRSSKTGHLVFFYVVFASDLDLDPAQGRELGGRQGFQASAYCLQKKRGPICKRRGVRLQKKRGPK